MASTSIHFLGPALAVALTACSSNNGATAPDAAPPSIVGSVRVEMTNYITRGMTVTAAFGRGGDPTYNGCHQKTSAPCDISICDRSTQDNPNPNPPAPVSGGTIDITGGGQNVELAPSSDSTYAGMQDVGDPWPAGQQLTVTGSGGSSGAPAFSIVVPGPGDLVATKINNAAWPAQGVTIEINRSTGVPLAWSGTSNGVTEVTLRSYTPTQVILAVCDLPTASGSGTVPASAITDLQTGPGSITVAVYSMQDLRVDDTEIHAIVGGVGTTVDSLSETMTDIQ